jgi:hypothetical protein
MSQMADVLFLSAKNKGSYDDAGYKIDAHTYIWKSFVSPGMQNSSERNMATSNQADLAL